MPWFDDFTYELDVNDERIKLNVGQMQEIHWVYERMCTAEYIIENNEEVESEEQAMDLAIKARILMDKYDYDECAAVDEVMETLRKPKLVKYTFSELGYFTLRECKQIKERLEGKGMYQFMVSWDGSAWHDDSYTYSYTLVVETNTDVSESVLRDAFIHALVCGTD